MTKKSEDIGLLYKLDETGIGLNTARPEFLLQTVTRKRRQAKSKLNPVVILEGLPVIRIPSNPENLDHEIKSIVKKTFNSFQVALEAVIL
ncbi:MAG: hypothetical protein AUI50_08515 [Crenarchaeota archaeon 13_1_40CM_2_52_14]|nr:MAG: hypothetical protein AUI97_00395 [Crenarchaeota archaeon 13_1_40CM_3_52_17]OLD33983.1 MAG: hypothetical protein AUI50_08515 [Crenarchaeota archaeon 13_1_40CM_2_52_14]OLE71256.1 MAG: hypothetical protein AUF78_02900 [archaeon 13_1_20CM_2_51_12]